MKMPHLAPALTLTVKPISVDTLFGGKKFQHLETKPDFFTCGEIIRRQKSTPCISVT